MILLSFFILGFIVIWRAGVKSAYKAQVKKEQNKRIPTFLEEMKTFVAEENGAFNAVTGCHDDLVSAFWLAIQAMKNGFWYPF